MTPKRSPPTDLSTSSRTPSSAKLSTDAEWLGLGGDVGDFLSTPAERWRNALIDHHVQLLGLNASGSQIRAWDAEHGAMIVALKECLRAAPDASGWSIVFEYELPMEGGRRPDVVVLAGATVVVLEFKDTVVPLPAYVDQVTAYASDLSEFHAATHGRAVVPIVVLTGTDAVARTDDAVVTTGPSGLAHYLFDAYEPGTIDLPTWLDAPYTPLPTLVAAARRIFNHEPLPHVRRALAVGIPETVALLTGLVESAEHEGHRILALVTGVPGSGKTLVGLRLVYERTGADRVGHVPVGERAVRCRSCKTR